jgi:hypothetical protein
VETASLTAMQASPAGQRMVDILSPVLHHDEHRPCLVRWKWHPKPAFRPEPTF